MRSPTLGMGAAALLVSVALCGATELVAPGASFSPHDLTAPLAGPEFDQNPLFRLDDAGNVYHLDSSFGRIRVNGQDTNWHPDSNRPRFLVSPAGDVYYENSYGRLCRNGGSYGYDFRRPGDFHIDDAGNLYWVKDWVDEEIHRNSWGTGYEIAQGSGWHVYRDGTVAWIDQDQQLHLNGSVAPIPLQPGLFYRDHRGDFWYVVHIGAGRWRLLRYDRSSGQIDLMGMLRSFQDFTMDHEGVVWFGSVEGRIVRDGMDTGFGGYALKLDGAGHCYHLKEDVLHRDGQSLGYHVDGYFDVTRDGDVFWIQDSGSGRLYRNDQLLPFRVR